MQKQILMLTLLVSLGAPGAWARDVAGDTPIQGIVVAVHGPRLDIQTGNGSITSVTTLADQSGSLVGKQVRGTLRPAGDGYLLASPVYSEPKPQ